MNAVDLRQRLYQNYVTTHLQNVHNISPESFESFRTIYRARYGAWLPEDKQASMLEIGCGYGSFLYFLQKEGYANAFGVDISPEQVELAKSLGVKNVKLAENLMFLKSNKRTFHLIAAFDVIEHYNREEMFELLAAAYDALLEDGVLLLQTPNADGPFAGRYRYYDFTHEIAFTRYSISQVLSALSFRNVEVFPVEPVVHGFNSALRWVFWKLIRQVLLFYLTVETGSGKDHILTQNLIAVARK
jgi:SAM-dependent methyltransferase